MNITVRSKAQIEQDFSGFKKLIEDYNAKISKIEVKDDVSETELSLMLKSLNDLDKQIDDKRKELNSPFQEQITLHNDVAKFVMGLTPQVLTEGRKKLADYRIRKEEENKRKAEELKKKAEEQKKTINADEAEQNVLKIRLLEHAKSTILKIAETETYEQLNSVFDTEFRKYGWDEFKSVEKSVEKTKEIIKNAASSRKVFVMIEEPNEQQLKDAQTVLSQIFKTKTDIEGLIKKLSEKTAKTVEKMEEVAVATIEANKLTKASTGLRKTWTFDVLDISKIPIEYLQVNEKAIKNYIAKNLQGTKKEEDVSIEGIRFYKKASATL